jgi:hypothetical protein
VRKPRASGSSSNSDQVQTATVSRVRTGATARRLASDGPVDQTQLFATWAFKFGIEGNDIPLGACVSLFMVPILGLTAVFILRDISPPGGEG